MFRACELKDQTYKKTRTLRIFLKSAGREKRAGKVGRGCARKGPPAVQLHGDALEGTFQSTFMGSQHPSPNVFTHRQAKCT